MDTNEQAQFKKDVRRFRDHIRRIITSVGLPEQYVFSVHIVNTKRQLVTIQTTREIVHFLEKRTAPSIEEKFLQSAGCQSILHLTGGEIFLVQVAARMILTKGNFGLACLSFALNDFFTKIAKRNKDKLAFATEMRKQLVKLIHDDMPFLLCRKRKLSTACKKNKNCQVTINLNPIIIKLGRGTIAELAEKSQTLCEKFGSTIDYRLRIDMVQKQHEGKLVIIPKIEVSGESPAEIISKIKTQLESNPDWQRFLIKY